VPHRLPLLAKRIQGRDQRRQIPRGGVEVRRLDGEIPVRMLRVLPPRSRAANSTLLTAGWSASKPMATVTQSSTARSWQPRRTRRNEEPSKLIGISQPPTPPSLLRASAPRSPTLC
jgi:hypothetical protein